MTSLDRLIVEHCPNGVELLRLDSLATFNRGRWIKASSLVPGDVPVVTSAKTVTAYHSDANRPAGSITVSSSGAYAGHVSYWPTPIYLSNAFSVDPRVDLVDPKYLYYCLTKAQRLIYKRAAGAGVPNIYGRDLADLEIPVPAPPVQREIVVILDRMNALQAELEAEREARSRQYAYYRDLLTSFATQDGVAWLAMGEVATIVRGASPRPIQAFLTEEEDGVNWIKIGDVASDGKYITKTAEKIRPDGAAKSRRVAPGDFVLSNSMSFGRPYLVQIEGCIHDGWLAIKDFSQTYDPDFLYHLLRSSPVYREMASRAGGGSVQNLNADIVKSLRLPAPALEEQKRIAAILDRFDTLVNDTYFGLPAEIEARRQQYGHYRDRLLTFEEIKT